MERVIEIDKEYRLNPETAIKKFFNKHTEISYWKETFEYMLENGLDHFADNILVDGTRNKDWTYSLHLYVEDNYTYICVIERS